MTVSFLTGGAWAGASETIVVSPFIARMVIMVPCEDWTLTGGQMN